MTSDVREQFLGRGVLRETSPELTQLIVAKDWAATPLGPIKAWTPALRNTVEYVLANGFGHLLWWGPRFCQIYNDAYRPVLGTKHPTALGQPAAECWTEIWHVIGPMIEQPFFGGPPSTVAQLGLELNRYGFLEETYFTVAYSPVFDDTAPNGIGGVLATAQEITEKTIGERRIRLLSELGRRTAESRTVADACRIAADVIASDPSDVPYALIYVFDETLETAELVGRFGISASDQLRVADCGDIVRRLLSDEQSIVIDDPAVVLGTATAETRSQAILVPLRSTVQRRPAGFMVFGKSPKLSLDDAYLSFFDLIAPPIATAITNARAYEAERHRAEALAELDRAKNTFFSNVSHEFRTPLTLIVGPLQELSEVTGPSERPLAQAAHRNALRLLKLVNTLLEFSRLESGRHDATFVQTDLAGVTRDLVSVFRSAIESAGLQLNVEIDLQELVYVDTSMWERIVLNLLSNALKFTLQGSVTVSLYERDNAAELCVHDTGIGIPSSEIPQLFTRFHRIRGARGRSHEGSGIGLALVRDLVTLHGGTITVESQEERGTTFCVRLPLGYRHLPEDRIAQTVDRRDTTVVEQYLADIDAYVDRPERAIADHVVTAEADRARILLVDDNRDLREYVTRILSGRYSVVTASNGVEALRAARASKFDLILTDVMMPQMDGFELLRAIRADEQLQQTPLIMLSARAGEDSSIEGLSAGADDYLVKPFSAADLLARVSSQIAMASLRDQALEQLSASEQRFRALAESMPHIVFEANAQGDVTYFSGAFEKYTKRPTQEGHGRSWTAFVHGDDVAGVMSSWGRAVRTGTAFEAEFRLRRGDGQYRWHIARAVNERSSEDIVLRWTGTITDVHDLRRTARERALLAESGRILSQSWTTKRTLERIAVLTVPDFADWCQIDLRTEDGGIQTVAIAHRETQKNLLAQRLAGKIHLNPQADVGSPYVIRTGQSQLLAEIPEGAPEQAVPDPEELRIYRELGFGSLIAVPLVAEGQTLGMIATVFGHSGRRYTPEDLDALEELGRRTGSAIQRATTFEREHRVAESFQEASLPASLPDVPGIEFDAVYVAGKREATIGGDWYDAVQLLDGRLVISIGDVAGSGLRAAVTMGSMRQIIRGIAQVHADPALMLNAADRALRLERREPEQFVTAFVGVLDPITRAFSYASAGHPPALLRRPDGSVERLTDGGLPLGLRQYDPAAQRCSVVLPEGSTVVLFTDGLIEHGEQPATGEDHLVDALARGAISSATRPAAALYETILSGKASHDDVAILTLNLRTHQPGPEGRKQRSWSFNALDADRAQQARREFADALKAHGASKEDAFAAELVFGELIGNSARHAPADVEVTLDWSGVAPVLHVLDRGPGFHFSAILPDDIYSESGRGLFVTSSLTQDFRVSRRPDGGSHARATLSLHAHRLVDGIVAE